MLSDSPTALYPCRHRLLQHMDSETRASWRLTCKQAAADVYEATTCLTWAKGEPTVCDILPRDLFDVAIQLLLPLELIKPKQPGPRTLAVLSKLPGLEQLTCAVAPLRPSSAFIKVSGGWTLATVAS